MITKTIKKSNFFYIDESGGILNNSPSFILGCTRTDTPDLMSDSIAKLLNGFEDELYFAPLIDRIRKEGFHAVDNHFDVRARFFAQLPLMNFRSFFSIINKSKPPFKELIDKKEETKIYLLALDKLLRGRFNNREDINVFVFEELQFRENSQQKILEDYFAPYMQGSNVSYKIVGKEEVNLATIDYMNYIFHAILSAKSIGKEQRMIENFELVKPKIAFINVLHSNIFFTRKAPYTIKEILQVYSG